MIHIEETIKEFVKDEWVSLAQVSDYIQTSDVDLELIGYGFLEYEEDHQFKDYVGYHLLNINNHLFGFGGKSQENKRVEISDKLSFKNILEFDLDIINSKIISTKNNFYKNFEAVLKVEAKPYIYMDEERLFFSKKGDGNIDLYCSYQIKNKNNDFFCKIHPSAFNTAKQLALNEMLEKRIKNMKNKAIN